MSWNVAVPEVSPFLFGGSDLLPTEKNDQTPPVLWAMIAKRAMCAAESIACCCPLHLGTLRKSNVAT
jgi:hypothetical protein